MESFLTTDSIIKESLVSFFFGQKLTSFGAYLLLNWRLIKKYQNK